MDNVLYRKVMRVLEGAGIPAQVRANIDSIFHGSDPAATTTYNPDNYKPPEQYTVWVSAGSPTHDALGRELDVRGQLTGGPIKPNIPAGEDDGKVAYFNEREGDMPGSGFWRVGFTNPGQAPQQTVYTIQPGYATNLVSSGDGGYPNGDVTFTVNGQQVPYGGALPTDPGDYTLVATCVSNTHTLADGALATFSIVKNG